MSGIREEKKAKRDGSIEFGITSLHHGAGDPTVVISTDLIADAYGRSSSGEKIDLHIMQNNPSPAETKQGVSNFTGIAIEAAGHQYAAWVTQKQGTLPKLELIDYTAPRDKDGKLPNVEINDPVLATDIVQHIYNAAAAGQTDATRGNAGIVPTRDFDTLAADAHKVLQAAGVEKPPTSGRNR